MACDNAAVQRLLIIGCGDVARRALPWLVRHYRVYAVVRSATHDTFLRTLGVTPIHADLDHRATLGRLSGIGNLVLHFAPPPGQGQQDRRSRALVAALARARSLPRRIVYISTTGVYGDCHGAWVGETRPPSPQTGRAVRRVDAERSLRRLGRSLRINVAILRVPGIYAADRLPLDRLRRRDPVLRAEDDVFTNHIHADDLASICARALTRARPGRVYNASDDSHITMSDYFDLVADGFDLPPPPRVSRTQAGNQLSPMALSFMSESRRVDGSRLRREFRLTLRYPDVLAGIDAALSAQRTKEL